MAAATNEARIVIIAGIAANLAESLSMAAVAYTSTKAYNQYYDAQVAKERKEIKDVPKQERKEIYEIYYKKGFRGRLLGRIVEKITSSKKLWLKTVMTDELNLSSGLVVNPLRSAVAAVFFRVGWDECMDFFSAVNGGVVYYRSDESEVYNGKLDS